MSDRVDRILELLDNGTQSTDEPAYPTERGERVTAACWRCGAPATTDLETCDACRAWMACETDDDPAARRRPGALLDEAMRAPVAWQPRARGEITFHAAVDEETMRTILGLPRADLTLPTACDLMRVDVDLSWAGRELPADAAFVFVGGTAVTVDGCAHPVRVGRIIMRHRPECGQHPLVTFVEGGDDVGDPDQQWSVDDARDVEVTLDHDYEAPLDGRVVLAARVRSTYRVHVHRGRRS